MKQGIKRISFAIGTKQIGAGNPILIQSMGDRKTTQVDSLVALTEDLAKQGLDLMRFSVLDASDAKAIGEIRKRVSVPVIADIHFDYRLALLALENGVDKIRINPGNIGSEANIRTVIAECKKRNVPIRIGCNSGSLNLYKGRTKTPVGDFMAAMDDTLRIFKSENFDHLVLSLKTSDPLMLEDLYEKAYRRYPYPLHLGLTESGFGTMGAIKSSLAVAPLLEEGIGDTIRVSLADDRREELRACKTLLRLTGRRNDLPELVVCPTCGRTKIDLKPISRLVAEHLDYVFKPVKVAVMGCPVNGVGEAKDADVGIAGSGKKDVYLLFSKGKPLGLFDKETALRKLFEYIDSFKA
jgi:(E)-4-hydroxy-3-methylbut-2-enyl-diphosphate synthase